MSSVHVKYKYKNTPSSGHSTTSGTVTVSKIPPTESEVLAALKKAHPKYEDIIILEFK
jgi:hypothetical protein